MSFFKSWFLEFVHTMPMILGFLFSLRFWERSLPTALVFTLVGILMGLIAIYFQDENYRKRSAALKGIAGLFLFYLVLAAGFLFYFSRQLPWLNWKIDIFFGVLIAILITIARKFITKNFEFNFWVYGLSSIIVFPVVILCMRWASSDISLVGMVSLGVFTSMLASGLISFLEKPA